MTLQSSWNMPPGCFVSDIPEWDDPEPWQSLIHCPFCGAWVSTKKENVIRTEQHTIKDQCCGTKGDYDIHPECPLGYWEDKTLEEINKSLLRSTRKYVIPEHGEHEIDCYAGITTWFRCHRCGASAPLDEF